MAFLFWMERRSTDKSCTDVQCYWKKDKLSHALSSQTAIGVEDFSKKALLKAIDTSVRDDMINHFKNLSERKNIQVMKSLTPRTLDGYQQVSLHFLAWQFKKQNQHNHTVQDFSAYVSRHMTSQICRNMVRLTASQSNCKEWYEVRYGRITAGYNG